MFVIRFYLIFYLSYDPRYYKQGSENLFEASKREAKNVRQNVGVCDVTTLGKIDIKGPDAAEFLNRVYTNAWLKLPVGKARYGVMLREDGIEGVDPDSELVASGGTWKCKLCQKIMASWDTARGPHMPPVWTQF